MNKILLGLLVLLFGCNNSKVEDENSTSMALSRVEVKGNQFVVDGNTPIIFRGLNTSDPDKLQKDGHWDGAYFREMKNWGANIVRFPIHPRAWRERGQDEYLRLLDMGIEWAAELELYVILDWHIIGNLKEAKFQHEMYNTTLEETRDFWRTMAKRYKDNTAVAFFELYNEPTVSGDRFGECTWAELKVIYEELIDIIRAEGCRAIPMVAGFNWAYDLTEAMNDPVNAEGIGYISHPYPQKRDKPWEPKWTADWGAAADKYPLMLTEIGFCGEDDRGAHIPVISDESYGDAITQYAAERGISWVVWVFDPNWSPMLFEDWSFAPTRQGRYFKTVLQKQ